MSIESSLKIFNLSTILFSFKPNIFKKSFIWLHNTNVLLKYNFSAYDHLQNTTLPSNTVAFIRFRDRFTQWQFRGYHTLRFRLVNSVPQLNRSDAKLSTSQSLPERFSNTRLSNARYSTQQIQAESITFQKFSGVAAL